MLCYIKRPGVLEEEEITRALYDFLRAKKWEILSYGVPRGMKARVVHDPDSGFRSKDSIIPDIIARRENVLLVMENKSRLAVRDVIKLQKMTLGHVRYMKEIFKLSEIENVVIQRALGLSEFSLDRDSQRIPEDFIIFIVDTTITVYARPHVQIPANLLGELNAKKI